MPARAPQEDLAKNLLPVIRVQGEESRWTMAERLAHYGVPGVSVAVIEDGELAWAAGFGVREQGGTALVDADTMFMGASTSKPVSPTAPPASRTCHRRTGSWAV